MSVKQLTNWFTNCRKRLWIPLKRQRGGPIVPFAQARAAHRMKELDALSFRNSRVPGADVSPSGLALSAHALHGIRPQGGVWNLMNVAPAGPGGMSMLHQQHGMYHDADGSGSGSGSGDSNSTMSLPPQVRPSCSCCSHWRLLVFSGCIADNTTGVPACGVCASSWGGGQIVS